MRPSKRRLCLLLACSLLLVFPVRTMIAAAEPDPNKPTLYVEYLGGSAAGPGTATSPPGFTTADVGSLVWIGVSIDEIWKFNLVKTFGVYNLDIGIEYNPAVLQPAVLSGGALVGYDTVADATQAENGWLDAIEQFNFSAGVGTKDLGYWDSSQYELMREASISNADSIDEDYREYTIDKRTKLSFVGLKKSVVNAATNRFAGVTEANTGHFSLIRMPFIIKSIPASGNPLMLSLSPSTFVMGIDANGWENYGAWEYYATQNEDDAPGNNLKWMFNLADPLNLFNTVDAALDDLQVWGNNKTTGADEVLQLYNDSGMTTAVTFDPDVTDYYVNVPHGQRAVDMYLSATDPPTVSLTNLSVTDQPVAVTLDSTDGLYKTDCRTASSGSNTDLTVVKLNTGQTIADSFQNHFTITVGGNVYNVYVRRLDEPRIELAYGNSPYGMIMRDASIDQNAAKATFDTKFQFSSTNLPKGANASVKYTSMAWGDDAWTEVPVGTKVVNAGEYINYDKDPYAVFAILETHASGTGYKAFQDPGFTITDSLGKTVDITVNNVTRTMVADTLTKGLKVENGEFETKTIPNVTRSKTLNGSATDDLIDEWTDTIIKPGVYKIVYSYHDDTLNDDVTFERTFVAVNRAGDVNFDTLITIADGALINNNASKPLPSEGTDKKNAQGRVYKYRIADVNSDKLTTIADGALVNNNSSKPVEQYYAQLD